MIDTPTLRSLGLVIDTMGQCVGIDLPISDNGLFAQGYQRRVRLKRLVFESNGLEMTVVFERYIVDEEGQDAYERTQLDDTLSASARRERMLCLQPIETTKTTRGAFRHKTTGKLVDADAVGAIPELLFFQHLALPHLKAQGLPLTGDEPYMLVVYLMLAHIIREVDMRGDL